MNWRLIFRLSLLSVPMGFASVFGFPGSYEWLMWLCIGMFSAWRIALSRRDELFLHGLYLGIFDGLFNSAIQAAFLSTYLSNNPRMVEALETLPQGLHHSLVILIMGPIVGSISGVFFGLLAVGAGIFVRIRISEQAMK